MSSIRRTSLFFLGVILQAFAVEARRGGGGGGGGGGGDGEVDGETVGIIVGSIIGMCAPSLTKLLRSNRNVSRLFSPDRLDTRCEEVSEGGVNPRIQ
jgi:hypothetical protein